MKKKIKLRDMSKEQWDKNRSVLCKLLSHECCENCIFQWVGGCSDSIYRSSWINHKDCYSDKVLDQEVEIEMPDILDEKEKEYLRAVVRPFRDKVTCIKKAIGFGCNHQTTYCIVIEINNQFAMFGVEDIKLPYFYFQNELYEGMILNRKYTLEELDL